MASHEPWLNVLLLLRASWLDAVAATATATADDDDEYRLEKGSNTLVGP